MVQRVISPQGWDLVCKKLAAHVGERNNWIGVVTPAIVCRPAVVRGLMPLLTGGMAVLLIPFGSPPVLRACLHIHQAMVVVVVVSE